MDPRLVDLGITRFTTGLPVTFASFGDNYLVQVQNNGVNSISMDLPDYTPGNLKLNGSPRNGLPYFNTSLFTPNALGTPGTASRRFFYGPGINNFDLALHKITKISESKSIELRFETFHAFNHAQFYGPTAVDGDIASPNFRPGAAGGAAPHRPNRRKIPVLTESAVGAHDVPLHRSSDPQSGAMPLRFSPGWLVDQRRHVGRVRKRISRSIRAVGPRPVCLRGLRFRLTSYLSVSMLRSYVDPRARTIGTSARSPLSPLT